MSSATIRHFPRLVRAVVTGVLPEAGWRTMRLPRARRLRTRVSVRVEGPLMAMTETSR